MTAAATSTITLLLFRVPTRPVPGELVGDPAAARAALQRPLQGLFLRFLRKRRIERLQPVAHDVEIFVLIERIERHPQAEALGERDLLLDGLPGMDLLAHV